MTEIPGPGINAVYFSRHALATAEAIANGHKLGPIIDRGFRFITPEGQRVEISVMGQNLTDLASESDYLRDQIGKILGIKNPTITIG